MNTLSKTEDGAAGLVPVLAVDDLRCLSWQERMRAYNDYSDALACRSLAHHARKAGSWLWRLDMRAALRAWRRYNQTIKAIRANHIRRAA